MIQILLENERAAQAQADTLRRAVQAAFDMLGGRWNVSVLLTDDASIQRLNADFRGIDEPTDVLSFAAKEGEQLYVDAEYIGDIAISLERAKQQAGELGHSTEQELAFLAVHGVLHLLGYDHMSEADERVMLRAQRAVITALEQNGR